MIKTKIKYKIVSNFLSTVFLFCFFTRLLKNRFYIFQKSESSAFIYNMYTLKYSNKCLSILLGK